MSDSLFASHTVGLLVRLWRMNLRLQGSVEKYLCVPAFLGKLTAFLPIVSYTISTQQDVEKVFETFRSIPMPEKPDGYDKYLSWTRKHVLAGDTINAEDRNKEEADAGENTNTHTHKKRKVMD